MKRIAIMQPYFLPYIGYWQLLNAVDEFVVYDNIEYTKKGWFNRNRILDADHDRLFTIPIKKDSDYLPVDKRFLSDDSAKEVQRTLRIIEMTYKKAPYFEQAYPIVKSCFEYSDHNLYKYIVNAISTIAEYLDIKTPIVQSSSIQIDHELKSQQKVLAICAALEADEYVNAIGGIELYDVDEFRKHDISLKFIKSNAIEYQQFTDAFVPWLSIIDVIMFNDRQTIKQMLESYSLV